MGNLLAANSNLSGSEHHYRQALRQDPEHADAYSSLRIISCYQKFHRNVQSPTPATEASSSALTQPTCSRNVNAAKCREAVFICTKVGFASHLTVLSHNTITEFCLFWLECALLLTEFVRKTLHQFMGLRKNMLKFNENSPIDFRPFTEICFMSV